MPYGDISNYTEDDLKNGVPLDYVYIVGPDKPGESMMAEDCELFKKQCQSRNLKYVLIGDGKKEVDLDISTFPPALNLIVNAHGHVVDGKHVINLGKKDGNVISMEVIKKIQDQIRCKYIAMISCYGGKAADDFQQSKENKLLEGTFFTAFSSADEASFGKDGVKIITAILEKSNPGEMAPAISLIRDIVTTVPETLVFGYQLKDELVSQTFLRKNYLEKTHDDIESLCKYQIQLLNEIIDLLRSKNDASFLNQLAEEKINQFQFEMNNSALQAFQVLLLENKINSLILNEKDKTELLDKFLSINEIKMDNINPVILKMAIYQDKNYFLPSRPWQRTKTLLKHYEDGAYLSNEDLRKADLSGANLVKARLEKANLELANLNDANLIEAQLGEASLLKANLREANLTNANLEGAKLTNANLTNANLTNAILLPGIRGNLNNANLTNAILENANAEDALLIDANLTGANLTGANFKNADLTNADLKDVNFSGADLSGVQLISVKNLNVDNLAKAKSIANIQVDEETLSSLSESDREKLVNLLTPTSSKQVSNEVKTSIQQQGMTFFSHRPLVEKSNNPSLSNDEQNNKSFK